MRIARDLSLYGYGFLVGLLAFQHIGAWWWIGALAILLLSAWLDRRVIRADRERGYGEGWDKGHEYGYEDGRFNGYGKGFSDALQKRSES